MEWSFSDNDTDDELIEARKIIKEFKSSLWLKQVQANAVPYEGVVGVDEGLNHDSGTDYGDDRINDDFISDEEDENGKEYVRKRNDFKVFDPNAKEVQFVVGMLFEGLEEFREALKRHNIADQKQFDYDRNT